MLERILDKLESMDQKLDRVAEKVAAHEEKNKSMQGQIKLLFSLLLAGVSSAAAAAWNWIIGNGGTPPGH